jgi:hypothetical protein
VFIIIGFESGFGLRLVHRVKFVLIAVDGVVDNEEMQGQEECGGRLRQRAMENQPPYLKKPTINAI